MNEYDCIDACKSSPLVKLIPGASYTIRDILLSKIAVSPTVTFDQVAKAIDELINLNYPLINRILEVSAYYCAMGGLFIYCANPSEFESLKLSGEDHGYFNRSNGLIVLSTRLPLSQLLIHEMTHAVRLFITINEDRPDVSQHQDFCKHTFPTLFSQSLKNTQPTREEQEELASIERKAKALFQFCIW